MSNYKQFFNLLRDYIIQNRECQSHILKSMKAEESQKSLNYTMNILKKINK